MDDLEKILIDQSITQLINQLFDYIIDINQPINHQWRFIADWGWEREERIGGEVQNIVGTWVEMDQ